MGTWGPGNFQNDAALDYISNIRMEWIQEIDDILADEERSALDEEGESVLMPLVVMLSVMIEHCGGVPPSVEKVQEWQARYLAIFDAQIDELCPRPGYQEERRQVIANTFGRLEAQARDVWAEE